MQLAFNQFFQRSSSGRRTIFTWIILENFRHHLSIHLPKLNYFESNIAYAVV